MLEDKNDINKDINKKLIKKLNELITILNTDYKEISNTLEYSDYSYINRVLNGKKQIEIYTLIKISKALIEINKSKKSILDEESLQASEILKCIGY